MRPGARGDADPFRQYTGQRLEKCRLARLAIAEDLSTEAPAQTTKNSLARRFRRFLTAGRETEGAPLWSAGFSYCG